MELQCACAIENGNKALIGEILRIIDNRFFNNKKIKTYDFQVRFYIRAIAEKALREHLINEAEMKKYIPPYVCDEVIELNEDAAKNGTRMGGYKGIISYDLARYVLCDHIEYRCFFRHYESGENRKKIELKDVFSRQELIDCSKVFEGNKEYTEVMSHFKEHNKYSSENFTDFEDSKYENLLKQIKNDEITFNNQNNNSHEIKIENFLREKGEKIGRKKLSKESFIIGAAYQYMLDCGWNEDDIAMIDSSIEAICYPASHGEKSKIMSFAEKYVWCSKNVIMGYLADNFLVDKNMVDNYIELEDVLNPITEYEQKQKGMEEIQEQFIPENLFEGVEIKEKENIYNWIRSKELTIDLEKWIKISNDFLVLNSYYCDVNQKNDLEYTMWISSAIIKSSDIKYLKDNIENNQQRIRSIIDNPNDFTEYTNSDGSICPFEIINFEWNETYESEFQNISLLNNKINRYKLYKTTESAHNGHTKFLEIHYKIPSKKIRAMLGINNNQAFIYKINDKVMSIYESNNKSWENHKNILVVDKKEFEKKLSENNEKMVWFIRVDKELSLLGRELYKDINETGSIFVICWFERGKLKVNYIKDQEQ